MSESTQDSTDTSQQQDRNKGKAKPKYDPIEFYQEKTYIDAKDSVNSWCCAQIIERCDYDSTLKVNFDGWSHRWDEWMRFQSSRIAPFRRYSQGYTGQVKYAIRDFKFSLEELERRKERLQKILDSNFEILQNPFETTQILRGQEPIYVDCLMQLPGYDAENIPEIFEYLKLFIQVYVKFLQLLPDYMNDYIEGISNADAFLTNQRIALAHCVYELSDTFNKIMGTSERLWHYFGDIDKEEYNINVTQKTDYAGKDCKTYWTNDEDQDDDILVSKRKLSKMICQLINYFGEQGGFEAWVNIFTYFKEVKDGDSIIPPFKLMKILLLNISYTIHYLNKSLVKDMLPKVKDAIVRRLKYLSDKEIKDLDKDILSRFITSAQALLIHHYPKDEVFLIIETAELDLALRFLTCPYFEKRLKGINEIKDLTEKIDLHEHFAKHPTQYSSMYSGKSTRYLSAEHFINWIYKNKVFELILGDSMHNEIIKRTHDILKFIAKYQNLPLQLIDLLWNSCEGKHEATLMGLYDLIIEIADHLDPEGIERLKEKIESIPDEEQNEMTLNLIKGFAHNTLPSVITSLDLVDQKGKVDETKYHCFGTLWKLMLDDSKVPPALAEMALTVLGDLLKERNCQPLRKVYLRRCFDNIKKKVSVSQSMNLIHTILNNGYYSHRYNDPDIFLGKILEDLDKEYELIELVVKEFTFFYKDMQTLIRSKSSDPSDDMRKKIWKGKYSYEINLSNRLVFMEYLITNESYEIIFDVPEVEALWDLIVHDPTFQYDQDYFLTWICRKDDQRSTEPTHLIDKRNLSDFFHKIICNHQKLDFINISPEGFVCFATFFRLINLHTKKFSNSRGNQIQVLSLDYEGKDSLWSMFLNCRNEKTIGSIINLLVDCNLKLAPVLEANKQEVWEGFVTKCVNLLKEGSAKQNNRLISKAVSVLMAFFDKFEGKARYDTKRSDNGRGAHQTVVRIVLKPNDVLKSTIMATHQTIGFLRKKISELFGIPVDEFKLAAKNRYIEHEEDDTPIMQYQGIGAYVIHRVEPKQNDSGEYHPKKILAENTENIDLLFKLLGEDIPAVKEVWELLMRLPQNQKIRNSLYEAKESWDVLLDTKSTQIYKLLYCLQIIETFLLDAEKERENPLDITDSKSKVQFRDADWAKKFFETGGFKVLIEQLFRPDLKQINNSIAVRTISLIMKIACHYFMGIKFSEVLPQNKENEFFLRTIELIHSLCEYSLVRESQETEADKESQSYIQISRDKQRIPENDYFESELIFYAQSLFLLNVQRNNELLQVLYEYPSLDRMLQIGLIESGNIHLRNKLSMGIQNMLIHFSSEKSDVHPQKFFIPILLGKTLDVALGHQERCETYFNMMTSILSSVDLDNVTLDVDSLLNKLTTLVKERKPQEKHHKETDIVLNGVLDLLEKLFKKYPQHAYEYGQEKKLISEILQTCLFEIPRRPNKKVIPGPKCKSQDSRKNAFKLLAELSKTAPKNLQEIIDFILPILKNGKWRTKRYNDWNIIPKENEKSSTGYVGLKNLGCICYMNSTIQQLFMIPTFRKAVLEVEDKHAQSTPVEDNILYQLKTIFVALNESEKQYFNPKGFCHSFKDWDGNPTNVFEQMDADEFFNTFMDRLENLIKGTKQQHSIKDHFGGIQSNELICKGCPHYSEREEPFLTVSVQVKNKKTIYQSLSSFIEGEMLEGDNAYFCEQCNKKVNTLRRTCLKKLPNHLIIALKRFEFDYDTMTKQKVNDYCEFPNRLNLEPYTQQGLRKAEKEKKKAEEGGEGQDGQPDVNTDYPPEYFEYKLTGIVIHLGSADSGHYYSLIQDQELLDIPENKRWYEFNDTFVSKFDPREIPSEAFGGEEKWKYFSEMGGTGREKIKNAYLLFYERVKIFEPEEKPKQEEGDQKKAEESKEDRGDESMDSTSAGNSKSRKLTNESTQDSVKNEEDDAMKNIPKEFLKQIIEKNQVFHMRKYVFSREFFEFFRDMILQREFTPNNNFGPNYKPDIEKNEKEYFDLEILKLGILFLLTAVIRDRARTNILNILPVLKRNLGLNVPACAWLIQNFTCKKTIQEYLLDCPVGDMKRFVVGVLSKAIRVLYEFEGKGPNNRLFEADEKTKIPTTILANFMNCCISCIFESKENTRDYTEFFKLFVEIASCGHETAGYLIQKQVIGRLMDFFYERISPMNEIFRNMEDVPFKEPTVSELGIPPEEKIKVRSAWEEMIQRRLEKSRIDHHSAHKSYLWQTVDILLKYCKVNGQVKTRCPWQVGDYDYEVNDNERVLLTPLAKFVEKVIKDAASNRLGYRSVARFCTYLCFNNQQFTNEFIEAIKMGLVQTDPSNVKSFFKCFQVSLELEDNLQNHRVTELMGFLIKCLRECSKYFIEMDYSTSFFIKIANRNEKAREYIQQHKEDWEWIVNWVAQYQTPPFGMSQQQVKLSKPRQLGNSTIKYDMAEYKARSILKHGELKAMLNGEFKDRAEEWDSDNDLGDVQLQKGQKVDIDPQGNGKYITGEVDILLEEMVNIKFASEDKDNQNTWIAVDSEQLAPHRAMQAVQEVIDAESRQYKIPDQDDDDHDGQDTDDHDGYGQVADEIDGDDSDMSGGDPYKYL